ncbi:hypothetical protein ACSLOB_29615, partial [Escherichia coli]
MKHAATFWERYFPCFQFCNALLCGFQRRDQENEDIALTVGKPLIENGRLVADTLRHLADNEIDSDYFA